MEHEHHKQSTAKPPATDGAEKASCAHAHGKADHRHGHPGHGRDAHGHDPHGHADAVKPPSAASYYCPMCEGVVSDQPGDCPKCGMALERNPAYREAAKTIWTCPMHPQIEQDHPGECPICGMALEPKTVGAASGEEDNAELRAMTRRFWIGAALALPVL